MIEDGMLAEIAREMLGENFRQDVIGVSIKGSVEDALSSAWLGNFKGLTRNESLLVRNILQNSFAANLSKSMAADWIIRVTGMSQQQAELIVDTEYQQIRNRARMLAYLEDDTEDSRYIWDTRRDGRVCPICDEIKSQCLPDGVPLEQLKTIITETQLAFGLDTARRYTAHPQDRCRIARLR